MCKYCNDYTQKVKEMTGDNAWFSLYEHYLEVIDDRKDGNILSFKIKYCPICGKNLGDGEYREELKMEDLKMIQLEERNKMLASALDEADKELTQSKHCQYCFYGYEGLSYDGERCRKCCHNSNFRRILAKELK